MSELEHKAPPQAVEVEEEVIGGMMIEHDAALEAAEVLKPDMFYKPSHRLIYKAMMDILMTQESIDILSVENLLRERGELESIGGSVTLVELTRRVSSAANIGHHAQIIKEKYILRQDIQGCYETIEEAFKPGADPYKVLEKQDQRLYKLLEDSGNNSDTVSIKDTLHEAVEDLLNPQTGLKTGLDIDKLTNGFQALNYILAARPGMGKTALALSIAKAVMPEVPVGFVSLEMSRLSLTQRLISTEAGISLHWAKSGKISENEKNELVRASERLFDTGRIIINDTPALTTSQIRTVCRKMKKKYGVGLIIMDYLQLGNSDNDKDDPRVRVSKISQGLVATRKELNIPIIALAQLSRAVENRGGNKRPQLADLKESGDIEQDADMVTFLYRPEYYGIMDDDTGSTKNVAEFIVGKHRDGPTGTKRLYYEPETMKFANLTKQENENTPF